MRRWRKWLLIGTGILLLSAGGFAWWLYHETRPLSARFQPQLVRLREPSTPDAIAQRLAERKLIRNPRLLAFYLRWKGKQRIAPGDYEFSPDQTLLEIARILIEERFTRNWVTIPEGWNRFRIAQRLHERGIADAQQFLALCSEPERFRDMGLPLPDQGTLEGYLFPSTYRLPPGSGAETAIRTMLKATLQNVYL
ncbi:MAG: endolytic transglycosylase MltG, partial [Fimbriimonadales bacterium]|nr:endolytic transglycosylase MltG [Fimbriimonadales bacterium]